MGLGNSRGPCTWMMMGHGSPRCGGADFFLRKNGGADLPCVWLVCASGFFFLASWNLFLGRKSCDLGFGWATASACWSKIGLSMCTCGRVAVQLTRLFITFLSSLNYTSFKAELAIHHMRFRVLMAHTFTSSPWLPS
jgi:hypothetical protein